MPSYKDESTGKWFCKFYYEDYTGKRIQKKKRGFDTKREALEWEREFLLKQQGSPDMSFQSLTDLYLNDISVRLKKNTYAQKKRVINNHILPYFGERVAASITAADVREWQAALKQLTGIKTKRPLTGSFIRLIEDYLTAIFNYGVKFYNLPSNPMAQAGHLKYRKKKRLVFWTQSEFNEFIPHVDDLMYRCLFLTLYYTGMRLGEALALTPSDVDFDNLEISITKTLPSGKERIPTTPKTEGSNRIIAIPSFLGEEIQDFINARYGIGSDDFIFPAAGQTVRERFYKYVAKAGVKLIRVHDLRHSHVALLIELNYQPLLIAERLGHDNVQTTLNTYSHLYPNKHREVADTLNEQFKKFSTK